MIQNKTRSEFRQAFVTFCILLAALSATFFPVLFEGKSLLPSDFIDTMTLPFSSSNHPQQAYNSLITDGYLQFFPLKYFTKQAYEAGYFAFWNPLILNGYPQYLDGMWTYNFVLFLPMNIAFHLILLLPLLIAGMGFYALLRQYDVRVGVARIFSTAYMLNALFITNLLVHFVPASFSLAPIAVLFLHKHLRTPKFKFLAISATALALGFLAGNLQTIGFLSFLVICYATSQWSWQAIRSAAITLVLATGLSMIMILPTLELFRETLSGGAFFSTSLLRPYNIWQRAASTFLTLSFFVPQLAGSFRGVTLGQIVGVYTQDFEGSIGFIPLLIAVWAAFSLRERRPDIVPFVMIMLAGFAIPIATPLFKFVYHRFFVIFVFGACGAGALGMEAILAMPDQMHSLHKWVKSFAYILLSVAAILTIYTFLYYTDFHTVEGFAFQNLLPKLQSAVFGEGNPEWVRARFIEALDYWRITRPEIVIGLATSFSGLALLKWKNKVKHNLLLTIIWFITFIQLAYFAHCWFPSNDQAHFPLYPETPETKILRKQTLGSRAFVYRELDPNKQFVFMDNENVIYGVSQSTGYESIVPRSFYLYSSVVHPLQRAGILESRFLGKFNISTLVAEHPLTDDSLTQIGQSGPLWIYHNNLSMPRAFLASASSVRDNDTAICGLLLQRNLLWPTALFTPDQNASTFNNSLRSGDTVSNIQDFGNSIHMNASSNDSAYLVLTDTYYPGWVATVDDNQVPILRCNYAMSAISIPPGIHEVKFTFAPASFRIGSWISVATILIIVLRLSLASRNKS